MGAGTYYRELVDGVRRDLARSYVPDRGIALTDVAYLVGFAANAEPRQSRLIPGGRTDGAGDPRSRYPRARMTQDKAAVGRFLDPSTAALRPPGADELAAYGVLDRLAGAAVLDVGAGDGRIAFGAATAGARSVVGVDPDPAALRAARQRARSIGAANVSFRVGAAQDLPMPAERFDLVILSWTL